MFKKLCFLFVFFSIFSIKAQESKKGILNIKKIGFLYNYTDENNFLFDDEDYSYNANIYKLQLFYNVTNWQNWELALIVQPQIQVIEHQLLNEQFVLPSENNYLEKRAKFTRSKKMHLYGLELGFALKRALLKDLSVQIKAGLGVANIDTETERLAKGFTFIENGSVGFSYKTTKKTTIYFGGNIGHVSNLNFKNPNSGYTFLGFEVGFTYFLK